MSSKLRISFAPNAGPLAAKPTGAPSILSPEAEILRAEAAKRLRLKKKEVAGIRLFVWSKDERAGTELPCKGGLGDLLRNDDLVAVSLGEEYQGPRSANAAASVPPRPAAASAECSRWLRWEPRSLGGSLVVVEWSDARTMNLALGRFSTLLEHPTLCGAETGRLVAHAAQRLLPSNKYLGHNLYAETLYEFERLTGMVSDASADSFDEDTAPSLIEKAFLDLWHTRGCPKVLISFVVGEASTLAHELCHARFALDASYRSAVVAAWTEIWQAKLGKWMGDLGYHASRHADEFGAYLLTEPPSFWRGRVPPGDVKALRSKLGADVEAFTEAAYGATCDVSDSLPDAPAPRPHESRDAGRWAPSPPELHASVPREDLTAWFQ